MRLQQTSLNLFPSPPPTDNDKRRGGGEGRVREQGCTNASVTSQEATRVVTAKVTSLRTAVMFDLHQLVIIIHY